MSALLQRVRDFFQPRPYHVTYVEGNIGAGKSTVLATLEGQHPNIKVVPENVEKFTLLQSRYRHPDRFFFSSQVGILPCAAWLRRPRYSRGACTGPNCLCALSDNSKYPENGSAGVAGGD